MGRINKKRRSRFVRMGSVVVIAVPFVVESIAGA